MLRSGGVAGRTVALMLGILALAALARAPALGPSLWVDEVWSVRAASQTPASLIEWLPQHDTHPPLYYLTLGAWKTLGSSEVWLRSLSLLASLVHVALLFFVGRALGGRRLGLLAAALGAVCYPLTVEATQARSFALCNMLATGAWLALICALQRGRWWRWSVYSLLLCATCYTFYYGFHAALALTAFGLAAKPRARQVAAGVAATVAAAIAYLPWLPSLRAQHQFAEQIRQAGEAFPLTFSRLLEVVRGHVVGMGPWGGGPTPYVCAGLLVGLGLLARSKHWGVAPVRPPASRPWLRAVVILCIVYLAMVVVAGVCGSFVHRRYATFFSGALCVLAAWGLRRVPARPLTVVLAVVLIVSGGYATRRSFKREYQDWRGVAAYLRAQAQPGDVIEVTPSYHEICLPYYGFEMARDRADTSDGRTSDGRTWDVQVGRPDPRRTTGRQFRGVHVATPRPRPHDAKHGD